MSGEMLNWIDFRLESRGRFRDVRDQSDGKYYRYYSSSIVGHAIMRVTFNYRRVGGQVAYVCPVVLLHPIPDTECSRIDFVPSQINPAMIYNAPYRMPVHSAVLRYHGFSYIGGSVDRILRSVRSFRSSLYFLRLFYCNYFILLWLNQKSQRRLSLDFL